MAFEVDLSVNIAGVKFENPMVLSEGPLSGSARLIERAAQHGMGAICTKSIRMEPALSANPYMIAAGRGLINADWTDIGFDAWLKELDQLSIPMPLITNVGTNHCPPEKAAELAGILQAHGASLVTFSDYEPENLVEAVRYARSGKILAVPALVTAALALPGSWLGTRAAMALGNRVMHVFMVFAIPAVGVLVLFRGKGPETSRPVTPRQYPVCAAIGLAVGFYDGFFGPGTGTLLIVLFTWLLGMDMVTASATCKPVNLASNVASLVTRVAAGNVLYALAVPAVCCSVLGGWLGAKLALTRGARLIRWVMLGVLALLTVRLAAEALGLD